MKWGVGANTLSTGSCKLALADRGILGPDEKSLKKYGSKL